MWLDCRVLSRALAPVLAYNINDCVQPTALMNTCIPRCGDRSVCWSLLVLVRFLQCSAGNLKTFLLFLKFPSGFQVLGCLSLPLHKWRLIEKLCWLKNHRLFFWLFLLKYLTSRFGIEEFYFSFLCEGNCFCSPCFDVLLFRLQFISSFYFSVLLDFCWLVDVKLLTWAYQKLLAVACLPGEFFRDRLIISRLLMVETGSLQ